MLIKSGNPVTAGGADMTRWRKVRQVSFDLGARTAWTSSDAQGGTPFADGIYTLAVQPTAQIGVMDLDTDQAALLVLGSAVNSNGSGDSTGFPDAFAQIARADVPSLVLMPSGQAGDEEDAENAIWFVAATFQGPSGATFGRINEGEIDNPFNITANAGFAASDQGDTDLDTLYRIMFMGPPAAAPTPMTWSTGSFS